jgi:hypothetical protein
MGGNWLTGLGAGIAGGGQAFADMFSKRYELEESKKWWKEQEGIKAETETRMAELKANLEKEQRAADVEAHTKMTRDIFDYEQQHAMDMQNFYGSDAVKNLLSTPDPKVSAPAWVIIDKFQQNKTMDESDKKALASLPPEVKMAFGIQNQKVDIFKQEMAIRKEAARRQADAIYAPGGRLDYGAARTELAEEQKKRLGEVTPEKIRQEIASRKKEKASLTNDNFKMKSDKYYRSGAKATREGKKALPEIVSAYEAGESAIQNNLDRIADIDKEVAEMEDYAKKAWTNAPPGSRGNEAPPPATGGATAPPPATKAEEKATETALPKGMTEQDLAVAMKRGKTREEAIQAFLRYQKSTGR